MPPPPHSRPENVLKRAQELIGVSQAPAALSILHEHVVSKRTRNSPIASLEPGMLLFVELCVDLRRGKLAKDGLYQYKNTAQNTNVASIELVFKKFIELAEQKVSEAQARADEVQVSETSNVDDLEASETPESILLSTVSGEQSKDRTDRAIVTPWLKFLWETYRTVLDIFKNNSRLEMMYQSTAHQAFAFCSRYQRKTEFRRLCELLRNHLQNVAKFSAQMHAINLSDPDTLQRHLDTRFQQLNVAVELELWQEAFRSVEDIHTLLSLSKRPAKPVMMANYFEKLTRIFLVSENYLFHAAAWSRYYGLLRQSSQQVQQGAPRRDHPSVSDQDMTRAASFVLLSALAIPVISTSRSRGALVDADEVRKTKHVRLTNLLGMSAAPTRPGLFKDALVKGLLKRCSPEIRDLYTMLEVDFHPLSICTRISPILQTIGADPDMLKYVGPLQQVILTRLFQQLSQVYESVQLPFVLGLARFPEPFQVGPATIEKFIMNGCKKGDLAIRIDHATGVLTFDADVFSSARALHPTASAAAQQTQVSSPFSSAGDAGDATGSVQRLQSTPAEIVRSQFTRLAKSLFITCQYVDPSFNQDRARAKAAALERAQAGAQKEHLDVLARRDVIERKKQAASTALAQKEKDLATQKRIRAQEQQAAEAQRLADEQRERDRRRLEAERQRVLQEEAQRALEELKRGTKGIDLAEIDVNGLDSGAIRAIKIRALEKEKNELTERLRLTGRRIDHLERAFRREEIKHLADDYGLQRESDRKAYDKTKAETLKEAEQKHKDDVALKHRLSRLVSPYETFRDDIRQQRKADFERRKKKAQQELESKMEARKREFRDRKLREKREREEAERRLREEEERIAQEAEEKAQADEERKQKLAEEKAEREEERRRLDEKLALQRAQEERAEAKLAAKKAQASSPVPRIPSRDDVDTPTDRPAALPERAAGGPPRIQLQPRSGGGPVSSWRDRQTKESSGANAETEPSKSDDQNNVEVPKRTGGYLPPARREGGATSDRWRPRESSERGPADRDDSPANPPSGRNAPTFGARGGAGKEMGERGGSRRDRDPQDGNDSPASSSGPRGGYVPPQLRDRGSTKEDIPGDDNAPARPSQSTTTSDGKYRPGAFSSRRN